MALTEKRFQELKAIDEWAESEYAKIPLADPTKLRPGDRVVFGGNNRWTCSTRINATCECGTKHPGWIMRHKYETQLWWDTDRVWKKTVLLKDWPAKKVIMKGWCDRWCAVEVEDDE